MKSFITRSISGTIYAALLVVSSLLYPPMLYLILLIFFILGMIELKKILQLNFSKIALITNIAILSIFFIFNVFGLVIEIYYLLISLSSLLVLILFSLTIFEIFAKKTNHDIMFFITTSFIYLLIPILCMIFLQNMFIYANISILLITLFAIWTYDSSAYIVGSLIGKNKLFERISPKKTWEGLVGGSIITILLALIFNFYYLKTKPILIISAVILIVFSSTIGDLFESKLKRNANLKDSGNIIPGHGGILDRIDSLLISAPTVTTMYLIYIFLIK